MACIKTISDGNIVAIDANGTEVEFSFDGEFTLNIPGRSTSWATDRGEFTDPPCLIRGSAQPMTATFRARVKKAELSSTSALVGPDIILAENGSGKVGADLVSTLGANEPLALHYKYSDGDNEMLCRHGVARGTFTEAEDGNFINYNIEFGSEYPEPA